MIGIITAIEEEYIALEKLLENKTKESIAMMAFSKGTIEGKDVVIAMSGQGKVHAACCCQILVDRFKVDTVLNVGIAGALNEELEIGDIVISDKTAQYDFDASGEGLELGQVPGIEGVYFQPDVNLIDLAKQAADELEISYKIGGILTADLFLDSEQIKKTIQVYFEGLACEMEGAAVGQACYLNNIPFLIIRSISDTASEGANDLAVQNAQFSSDMTTELVKDLIKKL